MGYFSGPFRLVLLLAGLAGVFGIEATVLAGDLDAVKQTSLPTEAQNTLHLIRQGGPFPYPQKDGSVFGNFEKRLPVKTRAYYREYTVPTPGSKDRGPRRIVAGQGKTGDVKTSGEYYYTEDHYRHFKRIQEE